MDCPLHLNFIRLNFKCTYHLWYWIRNINFFYTAALRMIKICFIQYIASSVCLIPKEMHTIVQHSKDLFLIILIKSVKNEDEFPLSYLGRIWYCLLFVGFIKDGKAPSLSTAAGSFGFWFSFPKRISKYQIREHRI